MPNRPGDRPMYHPALCASVRTLAAGLLRVRHLTQGVRMTTLNKALRFMAAGLLAVGLSTAALAQEKQADRQAGEATMTGCLTKDASGGYPLADEKTGTKMMVSGSADLEKHSANHKVTLT